VRNTTHCRRSASRVARERDAAKKPIAEPSEAKKMPKSCSESSTVSSGAQPDAAAAGQSLSMQSRISMMNCAGGVGRCGGVLAA